MKILDPRDAVSLWYLATKNFEDLSDFGVTLKNKGVKIQLETIHDRIEAAMTLREIASGLMADDRR